MRYTFSGKHDNCCGWVTLQLALTYEEDLRKIMNGKLMAPEAVDVGATATQKRTNETEKQGYDKMNDKLFTQIRLATTIP